MQESQLQAYLNEELSSQEREETEALLQEDPKARASLVMLREQDLSIQDKMRMLQQSSPLAGDAALARFYQRRAESSMASEGAEPTESAEGLKSTLTSKKQDAPFRNVAAWFDLSWITTRHWPVWGGAFVCLLVLVQLRPSLLGPSDPSKGAPSSRFGLQPKGAYKNLSPLEKEVVLQVGYVRGKQRMRRLGEGDRCRNTDTLGFAFTLQKSGYPYLFLLEGKKTHLLYPLEPDTPDLWPAGHAQLMFQRETLLYQLKRHKGSIRLVLLKTAQPLSSVQRTQLLESAGGPFSQRRGWQQMSQKRPQDIDSMMLWVQP